MYPTATATTSAGATKEADPVPTCYIAPATERESGAGSANANAKGSRAVLLFCLRGIAAFCWAASRRTLERMLLAYIQSSVDPAMLRSLLAGLIAVGSQLRWRRRTKLGFFVARRVVRSHATLAARVQRQRKCLGITCAVRTLSLCGPVDLLNERTKCGCLAGISLALSELCQDCRYGGGRIPLYAILDLSTRRNFMQGLGSTMRSETASKFIRPVGTASGEGRTQATHPTRTYGFP